MFWWMNYVFFYLFKHPLIEFQKRRFTLWMPPGGQICPLAGLGLIVMSCPIASVCLSCWCSAVQWCRAIGGVKAVEARVVVVGQCPRYFGSRVRPGICVKYFLSFSLKKKLRKLRQTKGGVLYLVCSRTCPKTFLQCFTLEQWESKAKHCRNVLGRILGRKN